MTGKRNRPLIDRLMERVDAEGDCWIWIGRIGPNGYGIFSADGQGRRGKPAVVAHRMVWGELVGDIADGLELDHLCRNRPCVNPDHLEPVTRTENVRRGMAGAIKRAKTHCAQGHQYTPENTYTYGPQNFRGCRTCRRAASLKFAHKKRGTPKAVTA